MRGGGGGGGQASALPRSKKAQLEVICNTDDKQDETNLYKAHRSRCFRRMTEEKMKRKIRLQMSKH